MDRERLRRLALHARDDEREEACALRLSPAQLELALALDPSTVLQLVEEAEARTSFELALQAVCDEVRALDARLEKMAAWWEQYARESNHDTCCDVYVECAAELRACMRKAP